MEDRRKVPGQTQFPLWAVTPGWQWLLIGVGVILALAFLSEGAVWLWNVAIGGA